MTTHISARAGEMDTAIADDIDLPSIADLASDRYDEALEEAVEAGAAAVILEWYLARRK